MNNEDKNIKRLVTRCDVKWLDDAEMVVDYYTQYDCKGLYESTDTESRHIEDINEWTAYNALYHAPPGAWRFRVFAMRNIIFPDEDLFASRTKHYSPSYYIDADVQHYDKIIDCYDKKNIDIMMKYHVQDIVYAKNGERYPFYPFKNDVIIFSDLNML